MEATTSPAELDSVLRGLRSRAHTWLAAGREPDMPDTPSRQSGRSLRCWLPVVGKLRTLTELDDEIAAVLPP